MIRCPFCDHKNPPGAARCAECQAELFASPADVDSTDTQPQSLDGRVLALVTDGRKIEAIKLYRDLTGAGLREAKEAVEALERDGSAPAPRSASAPRQESCGADADVLDLLGAEQKIRAIKLYRDKTGVGLAEAKNAVEALARANGLPGGEPSAGCGGAALLAMMILVGVIGYLVTRLV
ncbi:MAG TPA: ribosomal protein L7/L12 [Planctomycetaceae bacterium]|jgi:ribosomal protein L7/L12|nr:ribosomal protein L7/L12 [Planctomycetaceae bacterium]